MTAIAGGGGGGSPIVAGGGKGKGKMPLLGTGPLVGLGLVLSLSGDSANSGPITPESIAAGEARRRAERAEAAKHYGTFPGLMSETGTTKTPSVFKPIAPVMKPVATVPATAPTSTSTLPTTNAEWKQFAINANARTQAGLNQRPTFAKPQTTSTVTNNITINAPNVDGKVIVDGMGKYLKANGSLPFNLATAGKSGR
jgi:hypothetical protein